MALETSSPMNRESSFSGEAGEAEVIWAKLQFPASSSQCKLKTTLLGAL
jgi:hypothetical protein